MNVQVVILCEDEQMACFARRFLKQFGFKARQLREEKPPPGKGSGEQWVRERLPQELRAMRDGQSKALIVLTDADSMTLEERNETLRKKCLGDGVEWRRGDEGLLVLTPKRNIETWFAYLRGERVDETKTYPKYPGEADCRDDVQALAKMCHDSRLREPAPPSLSAACEEWKRMP